MVSISLLAWINARANQILISEDTYLLIRDVIHCDKLDKIQVKNIKHPIQTYEVRGDKQDMLSEPLTIQENGFSLFIDPNDLTQLQQKRVALEKALMLLNHLD